MCETTARVTTYAQLRADGHDRRWIEASLGDGTLERVRRGVYAYEQPCAAARAAAAHGGALACLSAARHHGLWVLNDEDDQTPHVWLNGSGHRRAHEPCTCVEHWDEAKAVDAFGLPSVPRVLRQILACRGLDAFFVSLESALHLGKISKAEVAWLKTHTNDAAREAILIARNDADSGLESLFRWRLRRFGLRIRPQITIVGVGRVDFLIGDRLIVEIDGKANHDDESHRHKDLVRDANAAAWDYVTLRFDYALVVHDWELVEDAILGQVRAGAHLHRR